MQKIFLIALTTAANVIFHSFEGLQAARWEEIGSKIFAVLQRVVVGLSRGCQMYTTNAGNQGEANFAGIQWSYCSKYGYWSCSR